ncbi:MAG TPA: phospholipid carrier-dependent glycosyltransferase, partial [Thermoanaerobaculia bacterium]|nr:phospholipid carrier-dependent glycosyltransferase [Thermoanaerobaculia bacterium]
MRPRRSRRSAEQRPEPTPARRSSRTALAIAAIALLAWAGAKAVDARIWATSDEPLHVLAARELRDGPGVVSNLEHPVGMKILAAAALAERPHGHALEAVREARRPFRIVFAALVLTVGLWVLRRAGPALGIAAALLVVVDPSLRAHGTIVQSDVPLTFFLVLSAALLDATALPARAGAPPRRGMLLAASGLAYGLAIATKYSAAAFAPLFLAAAFFRLRAWRRDGAMKRTLAIAALALMTALVAQELALWSTGRAAFRDAARAELSEWGVRDGLPVLLSVM